MKKVFTYLLVLIVLAALGLGAYWIFDRQQGGSGVYLNPNNLSIGDFFPFGTNQTNTPTPTPTNNPDTTPNPNQIIVPPRLWQISNEPQSGAIVFLASNTPTVRFVDKATGNIFESSLKTYGLNRVTNTTIPKIYEAVWQTNGKAVVMRYLDENNETIKSAFSKIGGTTYTSTPTNSNSTTTDGGKIETVQELQANFLTNNISEISVNPTNNTFAYVVKNQSNAQIFTTNTSATEPKMVFESPIKDWSLVWAGNTLGFLSKPSAITSGQFYLLKNNNISRTIANRAGLNVLPNPAGTKIFYSETKNSSFTSSIFDLKNTTSTATPFSALADKCVWSSKTDHVYCAAPRSIPPAQYPDHWYQGKISFVDEIWRIDTSSGVAEFVVDPSTIIQGGVDAINLTLDPNEEYLVFTNKKDSLLWGLRIAAD